MIPSFGVALPSSETSDLRALVEVGRAAESAGASTIIAGEVAAAEAFSLLGALAATTETARLGTGVVAIPTRSTSLYAMAFTGLESLAPTRILAGVGVGSRTIALDWHQRGTWPPPIETMRTFIRRLREVMIGGRAGDSSFRLQGRVRGPVPLVVGALNPAMLRLAGQEADGVLIAWSPVDEIQRQVRIVREAAIEAGRSPGDVEILCAVHAHDGPDVEAHRTAMRRHIVGYAMVPSHRSRFVRHVHNLDAVEECWTRGDRARAVSLIDDVAVDALSAIGPGAPGARVRSMRHAGVDTPVLLLMADQRGTVDGALATLESLRQQQCDQQKDM